jgi:NAD(P)-dependent dehydrogenase (short-subunit alcohol dehydrogenase family)
LSRRSFGSNVGASSRWIELYPCQSSRESIARGYDLGNPVEEHRAMKIRNQVAIVTGGGSGLGAETARMLSEHGARVAVLDLNAQSAREVAADIGGYGVAADISDAESTSRAIQDIIEALGPPRILVNCAGIGGASRVLRKEGPMPLEAFQRIVRINLEGTFNMVRLTAFHMEKLEPLEDGERGTIVNTASVAAYEGQIGQAAYAASKGGVVAMTLPIAREFARCGIRVNTIAPGIFLTPLLAELPEEAQKALGDSIPFPRRLGKPREFTDLVRTCVTNHYLNGETIRLDGGVRLAAK